jgi:hypothetical protein
MLLFALMIVGLSGQETAYSPANGGAGSTETYAAPVIRPYEPPSDFGRQVEEGDVGRPVRSRPITAPVAVEAYAGNYEQNRSTREASYEQAVSRARASADARMGPLDGVWSAVGADGRPVLDLVLSDRGPSRPVEGALSLNDQTRSTSPVASVSREGGEAVIEAAVEGRAVRLRLQPAGEGWTGTLSGLGRDQAVSLSHPGQVSR